VEVKHNTYFIAAQNGCGCLQDVTDLLCGRSLYDPLGKRLGGIQSLFLHCGKETNPYPCQNRTLAIQRVVTGKSEVARLIKHHTLKNYKGVDT
jgi:hypothetical protein